MSHDPNDPNKNETDEQRRERERQGGRPRHVDGGQPENPDNPAPGRDERDGLSDEERRKAIGESEKLRDRGAAQKEHELTEMDRQYREPELPTDGRRAQNVERPEGRPGELDRDGHVQRTTYDGYLSEELRPQDRHLTDARAYTPADSPDLIPTLEAQRRLEDARRPLKVRQDLEMKRELERADAREQLRYTGLRGTGHLSPEERTERRVAKARRREEAVALSGHEAQQRAERGYDERTGAGYGPNPRPQNNAQLAQGYRAAPLQGNAAPVAQRGAPHPGQVTAPQHARTQGPSHGPAKGTPVGPTGTPGRR